MQKNRILVFNRATQTDTVENPVLFKQLVGPQYKHFCYLYQIITDHGFMEYIDDVSCQIEQDMVNFFIRLNKKYTTKLKKILELNLEISMDKGFQVSYEEKDTHHLILHMDGIAFDPFQSIQA